MGKGLATEEQQEIVKKRRSNSNRENYQSQWKYKTQVKFPENSIERSHCLQYYLGATH